MKLYLQKSTVFVHDSIHHRHQFKPFRRLLTELPLLPSQSGSAQSSFKQTRISHFRISCASAFSELVKVKDWNSNRFISAPDVMNGSGEDVEVTALLQPGKLMMSNELDVSISSIEHFSIRNERLSGKFSAFFMFTIDI